MRQSQRVILLAMYGMERIDRGSTVRIHNVHRALASLVDVDYLTGERSERRQRIRQYLRNGALSGATGLHVEACTSWCTVEDLWLMAACRRAGVPVLTWIPDAYPLFPETYGRYPTYKRLIVSILWQLSVWGYFYTSDAIGTQSESFRQLFRYPSHLQQIVLEPGANVLKVPPISDQADAILYTGNASLPRFGVDMLVEASAAARYRVPNLRLLLVCPPTGLPPESLYAERPWIELINLETDEIPTLLPQVRAVVNPLRDAPYHRLQIPTKIMGYLGYGRPILATDLPEIRGVIEDSGAGVIVPDTVEGLAEGIVHLFTTDVEELNAGGQNALRAVREKHAWRHRAQQILDTFAELRQIRTD